MDEKRRAVDQPYWHELELVLITALKDMRYIADKHNAKFSDVCWDAALPMAYKATYEENKEKGREWPTGK